MSGLHLDTTALRLLLVSLVLSGYVTAVYITRIFFRKFVRYDWYSEWFGHGLHAPGMVYMSLVMLGWSSTFIPFGVCVTIYLICAGVFVLRLVKQWYTIWWWDILHVVGSLAMAYMFYQRWNVVVTLAFMLYYLVVIGIYVYYIHNHHRKTIGRARFAHQLSNSAHIAMAVAMIIMFLVMQWPGAFPGSTTTTCAPGEMMMGHTCMKM